VPLLGVGSAVDEGSGGITEELVANDDVLVGLTSPGLHYVNPIYIAGALYHRDGIVVSVARAIALYPHPVLEVMGLATNELATGTPQEVYAVRPRRVLAIALGRSYGHIRAIFEHDAVASRLIETDIT